MRLCSVASRRWSSLSASTSSLTLSPWSRLQHQHRVLGRHHRDVVDADHRRQQVVGTDVDVLRVEGEAVALDGVAVGVVRAELPHRVPIADVRPADVGRHHRGALGALHHRVVDRLLRRALERRLVEHEEAEVVARRGERRGGRFDHFRLEGAQLRRASRRRGRRSCRSSTDSLPPRSAWRFRDRASRRRRRRGAPSPIAERLAGTDVAVTDRRLGRRDAERDDRALGGGGLGGGGAGGEEALLVEHDMVGGEDRDDGLRVARRADLGGDRHRRAGIAARRLDDDRRLGADLFELLAHQKAVVAVGDDDRLVEHRRVEALDRLLEGRRRADQRNELLRHGLARFRPHPRAGAAAHDDRQDFPRHFDLDHSLAASRRASALALRA